MKKGLLFFVLMLACFTSSAQYYTAKNVMLGNELSSVYFVESVKIDVYNNKFVSGIFTGLFNLQGKSVSSNQRSIFLAKFNKDDSLLWIKKVADYPVHFTMVGGTHIDVDKLGACYLAFHFGDSINIGSTINYAKGIADVVIFKFDSIGNQMFTKILSGSGADGLGVQSLVVDELNNMYLTGSSGESNFQIDTLILGVDTLYTEGQDVFIIKYDNSGNLIWAKMQGGIGRQFSNAIAVEGNRIYVLSGIDNGAQILFDTLDIPFPNSQYNRLTALSCKK